MTCLLIHGFNGAPNHHWYASLGPLLESAGLAYIAPAMPEPNRPQCSAWLSTIKTAYDNIDGEIILVGHSLGTRAALLFLEQYQAPVKACLLVGAFSNDIANGQRRGSVYGTFFEHLIDITVVKLECGRFIVLHSTDDQSIPYAQGAQIAGDLDAELMTQNGFGHFTSANDASLISQLIIACGSLVLTGARHNHKDKQWLIEK